MALVSKPGQGDLPLKFNADGVLRAFRQTPRKQHRDSSFDWQTRVLPGRVIALGIGSMVAVIRALQLGPTATTAKTAEQTMAIAEMFIAGVVGGFIVFLTLRSARRVHGFAVGLVLGVILGVPAVLITLHGSQTTNVEPWAGAVWVLGAFLVWGAVLGQSQERLIGRGSGGSIHVEYF